MTCPALTGGAFYAVLHEGRDFVTVVRPPKLASGNRGAGLDYHGTLTMAKEFATMAVTAENSDGRKYRCEETPPRCVAQPEQPNLASGHHGWSGSASTLIGTTSLCHPTLFRLAR
jgi:hypothetical protein